MAGQVFFREHILAQEAYAMPGSEVSELVYKIVRKVRDDAAIYIGRGHVRSGRLLRGLYANEPKAGWSLQAHGTCWVQRQAFGLLHLWDHGYPSNQCEGNADS